MSLPDGKYTFSTIANVPSGADILIGCYYKSDPPIIYKKNLIRLSSGRSSTTVSLHGVEWLDGYIEVISGETVDTTLYPMLVLGSIPPTAYLPYAGQTSTLTLPHTIYGGTVDAVTGEGQETWKLIDSYAGEDLPGKWISDRNVYASGTAPTIGAQVAYKLTEPISFTATGAQFIHAMSGVNTVLTDADSAIVTGRADPIKRITDLEDAVASMTNT